MNAGYADLLAATISSNQFVYAEFPSVITIAPSTVVRLTLAGASGNADASGNRWNNVEHTWDSDADSLALKPFSGTAKKTYYDGSSWTDTPGSVTPFALLLDTAGEFGTNQQSLILQPPSSY